MNVYSYNPFKIKKINISDYHKSIVYGLRMSNKELYNSGSTKPRNRKPLTIVYHNIQGKMSEFDMDKSLRDNGFTVDQHPDVGIRRKGKYGHGADLECHYGNGNKINIEVKSNRGAITIFPNFYTSLYNAKHRIDCGLVSYLHQPEKVAKRYNKVIKKSGNDFQNKYNYSNNDINNEINKELNSAFNSSINHCEKKYDCKKQDIMNKINQEHDTKTDFIVKYNYHSTYSSKQYPILHHADKIAKKTPVNVECADVRFPDVFAHVHVGMKMKDFNRNEVKNELNDFNKYYRGVLNGNSKYLSKYNNFVKNNSHAIHNNNDLSKNERIMKNTSIQTAIEYQDKIIREPIYHPHTVYIKGKPKTYKYAPIGGTFVPNYKVDSIAGGYQVGKIISNDVNRISLYNKKGALSPLDTYRNRDAHPDTNGNNYFYITSYKKAKQIRKYLGEDDTDKVMFCSDSVSNAMNKMKNNETNQIGVHKGMDFDKLSPVIDRKIANHRNKIREINETRAEEQREQNSVSDISTVSPKQRLKTVLNHLGNRMNNNAKVANNRKHNNGFHHSGPNYGPALS